eukprot:gene7959-8032_t
MKNQLTDVGLRDDLISNEDLRIQSAELIAALVNNLNDQNINNAESADFDQLIEILGGISISRARQGFSPRETESLKLSRLMDSFTIITFETFIRGREEVILRQTDEITDISTPVIKVWDGILALPIIDTESSIAILDISGVPTVDSLVAQHLLKAVSATRLMGADCIISGIRPEIAQTIVHLGIDLSQIITKASLASALQYAFKVLKLEIDLYDRLALDLEADLVKMVQKTAAKGVLIDISAVSIVDSFMGRILGNIAGMSKLLDAETVVVGMQPAVAITLVELGLPLKGVFTALNKTMILTLSKDLMQVSREQDVVPFRNRVKECAVKIKMGLVNQTKLLTAASELTRNMLRYGNGGHALIEIISRGRDNGVRLTFSDKGPGIADIPKAMQDGYSTGKSLGLGLPGTKRGPMVDATHIRFQASDRSYFSIIKKDIHQQAGAAGFDAKKLGDLDLVVSEMTSNLHKYAKGGEILAGVFEEADNTCIEIISIDTGPGMIDPTKMMIDGNSSSKTMGMGLGSIKRLSDVFDIYSLKDWGTIVLSRIYKKPYKNRLIDGFRLEVRPLVITMPGQKKCGDGTYYKCTDHYLKMLVADGLGHGPEANHAVNEAVTLCSDGIKSRWELSKLAGINRCDLSIQAAAIYKDFGRQTDDMTAFATAVSEVCREVIDKTENGNVSIEVEGLKEPFQLAAIITFLEDKEMGSLEQGLQYAQPTTPYEEIRQRNAELYLINEQSEIALLQSEYLNQQKSEFLSVASHELKTPLTILRAFTQMALREGSANQTLSHLKKIDLQAQKMQTLIQQLLDIAKVENAQVHYNNEQVDFNSYFADMADLIAQLVPTHQLVIELGETRLLMIDKLRIEQVIMNLVGNAAKYSAPGTFINISTSISETGDLIIAVKDEGIGMSADELQKVFDKFYRVESVIKKYNGFGMGLFISSKIITDHGGELWAESTGSSGSTFKIRLPVLN